MIKKSIKSTFWVFLFVCVFLQVGAIRKNKDAVVETQTDPISLKKKLEETKDGVKGAPTPVFEFYKKEQFLTKDPMKVAQEAQASKPKPSEEVSEVTWDDEGGNWDATEPDAEEEDSTMSGEESSKDAGDGNDEEEWWIEDDPQEVPQNDDIQS